MEGHPPLARNIPRIAPPRSHARNQSRSPTRIRLGDDLLSDLSPAGTLEAFTSPSGKLKASIEAATPPERAFGIRAAVASKKIQEWVTELSDWPWPAGGGSLGFEMPAAKRRKLSNSFTESRPTQNGFANSEDSEGNEPVYIGSLLSQDVEQYESRIDEITEEMDELHVEEIKRQVLDTHFSPRSRPSSSASNAPMPSHFASYTKMDDFTAVVTAIVLQTLPNLSRLVRLMDVWTVRLTILRKVPPLLGALDDAEVALQSGWNTIENPGLNHSLEVTSTEGQTLSRKSFEVITDVLQLKVTTLGKELDFMLDTLEGRPDTLPDSWLERMEAIEKNYGEWVVAGDRKVRQGEWALMEKKRREAEEAKRLKAAEEERRKAEVAALEAARIQALREAEEAEAAKLKALRDTEEAEAARLQAEFKIRETARLKALRDSEEEAARLKAENDIRERERIRVLKIAEEAEKARLKALKDAEEAETARLQAEFEAQERERLQALKDTEEAEIARLNAEEAARIQAQYELQEKTLLKALKDAEDAETARLKAEEEARELERQKAEADALEAARLEALREAEEAARLKSEHEARERARLKALKDAEETETARLEAEKDALEAARIQALKDAEEAERARVRAEEEAREIDRRKAEKDALEAARLTALLEAQEAEAARLRLEALEIARLKALKDAEEAEIARVKAESEAAEIARLEALREAQDAENARLKAEEESRENLRLEAARIEATRLKAQQEAAEVERLRLEQEARDVAQQKADQLLKEAQAAEIARDEAQRRAAHEAEIEGIRMEHAVREVARIQAEQEALEAARLKAELEDREIAERIAQQNAIAAAKEKAERDSELARLKAEQEAQEATKLQLQKDAEAAEAARVQAEHDAELTRIQEREIEDAARIQAEQDTEIARLQLEKDATDAAPLKTKQEAEAVETLRRQVEQEAAEAEIARQSEIAKQINDRDVRLAQQDLETKAESNKTKIQNDIDSLPAPEASDQKVPDDAEIESSLRPKPEAEIIAQEPAKSMPDGAIKATEICNIETALAVGTVGAVVAWMNSSKEEAVPVFAPPAARTNPVTLHCGCPAFDGTASKPFTPVGEDDQYLVHSDSISVIENKALIDGATIDDTHSERSSIDPPDKLNIIGAQQPGLDSPIHFDKNTNHSSFPSTSVGSPRSVEDAEPDSTRLPQTPRFHPAIARSRSASLSSQQASDKQRLAAYESSPHAQATECDVRDASPVLGSPSRQEDPISMFDGANESRESPRRSNRNGWVVIDAANRRHDPEADSLAIELRDMSDRHHKVLPENFTDGDETVIRRITSNSSSDSTLNFQDIGPREYVPLVLTSARVPRLSMNDGSDFEVPSTPIQLLDEIIATPMLNNLETPPEFTHEDSDELEASVLSPVLEETLMPSIEVDAADGSCDACDNLDEVGEEIEIASPILSRKTSLAHLNNAVDGISIQRRDSISSDTSTIITGRVEEGPSSPVASPVLDGSIIESFDEDLEQSPSAGRVGQRTQKSYDLSPPASPSKHSRKLSKQRSLQILKTPGYSSFEPTAPSTPLEAPVLENIDVTAAPLLDTPRKANNDEQLQQQISSLLEKIPARIRLTSDHESVSHTAPTLRPKKARRSVTPNFRPSSSMSNYSTNSRAQTPSFTLAPAFSKTTQRSRVSLGHPEIKLYHLSRSTGEAPIKLFVRLVGENGERVMVRVGGGWADLGEYLKEYASHHGRRSTADNGDKIEIQDLPPRVVSGTRVVSNSSTTSTMRGNGRSTPLGRPMSVMDNRPGSSLNMRKTRRSMGAVDSGLVSRSNLREDSVDPSTPLRAHHRRSYDTPPSATSIASSNASGTGPSAASGRSSRMDWTEEDSSLGLAGPKAKKVVISEKDQEWVESMKEKVKLASAEKERRNRERERLERERERKTSFGEIGQVGGTKRLFRKGLAEKIASQQKTS